MAKTLTTCPYCGCGCGLYLSSNNKMLTGVFPSKNHPVAKGSLCVKGWNSYQFVNSKERLTVPLIKKNGNFVEASWDEALTLIVSRLKDIKNNSGSDSIAFFSSAKATNEENYLLMKLARAVFKTNNIDHCARLCHASTITGLVSTFGSGAMTNSINEFEDAELFLITGSDTTAQHPLVGTRIINAVKDKGAKLIVVDPRKIELVKYADIYARQNLGTDVAWINGVMNVIISEDLHDKRFIMERTEGFEELKEVVKNYTPEYVEEITSIPADTIKQIARMYATHKKAMIVYAMGITQHTTGVDNVRSLANLAMLTGHVGFPSTGVNPLRGQNNVQGACDVGALPDVFTGYQKVINPEIRKKFEKAWGVEDLPDKPGLTVTEVTDGLYNGNVKALFIMGENPVISDPDSNHVRKALQNADFLVVQDIFLTDTAVYADVVLPGATFAEKDGTFTNTERRVERVRKAVDPPGAAKADWEIISEIADRMDYKGMKYNHPSEIMDEIASVTPIYGGIDYDRLDPWGLQWPCPTKDHPGTPYLHKDKFSKGKGSFVPAHYQAPFEQPDEMYKFSLTTGRLYWHWHTRTMTERTNVLEREAPEPFVEMSMEDAERLSIKSGERVRVTSRRGSVEVKVVVTDRMKQGNLYMPFHYREAAANVLTSNAIDPQAKIPEYKVSTVKVEKL